MQAASVDPQRAPSSPSTATSVSFIVDVSMSGLSCDVMQTCVYVCSLDGQPFVNGCGTNMQLSEVDVGNHTMLLNVTVPGGHQSYFLWDWQVVELFVDVVLLSDGDGRRVPPVQGDLHVHVSGQFVIAAT